MIPNQISQRTKEIVRTKEYQKQLKAQQLAEEKAWLEIAKEKDKYFTYERY